MNLILSLLKFMMIRLSYCNVKTRFVELVGLCWFIQRLVGFWQFIFFPDVTPSIGLPSYGEQPEITRGASSFLVGMEKFKFIQVGFDYFLVQLVQFTESWVFFSFFKERN